MTQNTTARWSNPDVILVATNLFEGYSFILHAIYQAKLSHARVLLVHVIPISRCLGEAMCGRVIHQPSLLHRSARARLEEFSEDFRRAGIECEPIILNGVPEVEIPLLIKSRSVDRLIVATRNVGGIARLVGDSVVEKLIAGVEVPICIIGRGSHPGAAIGTPLGRILLATSLHLDSLLLVGVASSLAEAQQSQLTLLHVLNTEGMSAPQLELARTTARKRLSALVPDQAAYAVAPIFLVDEGDPAAMILREGGSMAQDLIILGSPQPSAVSWRLDTSVVRRVAAESQCPILVMRPTVRATSEYLRSVDAEELTLSYSGEGAKRAAANHSS